MNYKIIDCHTHVYPDKIATKAVESIGHFYDIPMELDGTVNTLLNISRQAGVDQCLIHGVAVDALHVRHINDFVIATVQAHPDRLMGFGTLHPDMEDPGKELDRMLRAGLCGVKLHPDMQKFSLGEARTDRLFAVCEGVCPMLFHTGDKRYQYSNPALIPPIMKKHPHLTLICAHFGGYSEWDDAVKCLADENVYVDSSSSFFTLGKERARELIDLYGADRVLFGSDYPMWQMKAEKETMLSLELDDNSLKKIFCGNLLRILGKE